MAIMARTIICDRLFHVLADALTSVLAILALLAGRFLGWTWLDPAMGIVGGVVIARWSWTLMRDTAAVLLDRTVAPVEQQVRQRLENGDFEIADLHVWRVGPEAHAAIVSIVGNEAEHRVRQRLGSLRSLSHLTIEVRPSSAGRLGQQADVCQASEEVGFTVA